MKASKYSLTKMCIHMCTVIILHITASYVKLLRLLLSPPQKFASSTGQQKHGHINEHNTEYATQPWSLYLFYCVLIQIMVYYFRCTFLTTMETFKILTQHIPMIIIYFNRSNVEAQLEQ